MIDDLTATETEIDDLMTLQAIVRHARTQLAAAGIPAKPAAMDADLLARHVLGWDRATLVSRAADEAPARTSSRGSMR